MLSEKTQLTIMTEAQLKEFATEVARATLAEKEAETNLPKKSGKRYVYGLRGISELFNVSIVTAQKYKNTFLAPAVSQRSRKIVTDAAKAMELFNARQEAINGR